MTINRTIFIFLLFLVSTTAKSQDPERFREEVAELVKRNDSIWDETKETIVFAGSSSIRFWDRLQTDFPCCQIINSGFGGSQASDLIFYTNELILRYQPGKVFIYEGDNDISEGKRPGKIVKDINTILLSIWQKYPETEVVLISAKPSISRWNLRRTYKRLNRRLMRLAGKQSNLEFVDVWTPMLSGRKLKENLFVEDGLHMNQKGYEIWKQVIDPYVKQP